MSKPSTLRKPWLSLRDIKRDRRRHEAKHGPMPDVQLPPLPTRSECRQGVRPCPHVRCRYHLFLEARRTGAIAFTWPMEELGKMRHSCALDVAEGDPQTLDRVSDIMNVTRERVRQEEFAALKKVGEYLEARGLKGEDIRQYLSGMVWDHERPSVKARAVHDGHAPPLRRKD